MLDNLKNHIEDQREAFEIYPFDPEEGWKEIANEISPQRKWTAWRIFGAAACLVLVIFGALHQITPQSFASPELVEMERYYNGEINQKIILVKGQIGDDAILADLAAMDKVFLELKEDLKDNVDNEEVIAAMMENYQLKLQILEEILSKLEREKS